MRARGKLVGVVVGSNLDSKLEHVSRGVGGVCLLEVGGLDLLLPPEVGREHRAHLVVLLQRRRRPAHRRGHRHAVVVVGVLEVLLAALPGGRLLLRDPHRRHHGGHHVRRHELALVIAQRDLQPVEEPRRLLGLERLPGDASAVHRAEVRDVVRAILNVHARVLARDRRVVDGQVALKRAADEPLRAACCQL